ncbi:MAG: metal transporter [Actinobacteria bacterium]|nr:metal transporter [Actinomycetota bacterium]
MEARAEGRLGNLGWRLWALVPVVLLVVAVGGYVASGASIAGLIGTNPPQADEFAVRRVEFKPGEIRVRVTNPQEDDLAIASVTVDDAIVPFTVDGDQTLGRLRSSTIVIPFQWVADDPISIGVTSGSGIETLKEVPAAVETPGVGGAGFLGYAILGFLVGVLPVALGLMWLPSLRRIDQRWLTAFMALTAGMLASLGIESLFEAFVRQAAAPGAFGGPVLVLLGVALSYLGMVFVASRFAKGGDGANRGAPATGYALALLVAVGIGVHNLGEGLAIGTSFAFGELTLGSVLVVGFMIQNVTEGLGIAAPAADTGRSVRISQYAILTAVAGLPTIVGAWIGGFLASDILAILFFGAAAGAALEVLVEVVRYVRRRDPAGLESGYAIGGFLAGIALLYITGLIAG